MKYTDLIENYGFARNMQETNWLKLFPHWWSENDPLLETIGKEISFLKAQGIFTLLNTMVKPPVMIWQNSVIEKEYTIADTFTDFNIIIENEAPLYKTFGSIKLINYSDENIHNLKVGFTDTDYIIIQTLIKPQDNVVISVGSQEVTINNRRVTIQIFGDGVSYFKTQKQVQDIKVWNPQQHYFSNEILRINIDSDFQYNMVHLDVEVIMDNAVFVNEQNIEITGLELVPIKSMELYVYYDFPFNRQVSGWQKASDKVYIEDTNVIYDMITTKFNTKKFYVDVWYKGLDYPYRVGFPAQKNVDDDSIYHVNKELDTWGEYFGLKRRFYKENIPEEDYPYTYPPYYPYDVEQDYWYYQRLINEYTYVEWAINDVDLVDTNGTPIVRLHSIDPFAEDLVVHAKSVYPTSEDGIKTKNFIPITASQKEVNIGDSQYRRSEYRDIQNLLKYDNNKAYITLRNKIGAGITYQQYLSKLLKLFFDLKDLEEDIHIEDLQILVEAEATDNKDNKYSNEDTGIIIPGISDDHIFPLKQNAIYELEEKEIVYDLSLSIDDILSYTQRTDSNIVHEATIGRFSGEKGSSIKIPFTLRENDEIIDDITKVYVSFGNEKTVTGEYYYDGKHRYVQVFVPNIKDMNTISIACKTLKHNSFIANNIPLINVEHTSSQNDSEEEMHKIYGPSAHYENGITVESDNVISLKTMIVTDEWHTGDLRNILQKEGLYFVNVFQNDDETNTPTILIKNVSLRVSYSPKKTDFELNTKVIYQAEKPAIAQLKVEVTNKGDKDLQTVVDIVSATNLSLSKTYFTVDLRKGDVHTEYINITPEYPLIDGQYEVLTVCEDQSRINNVYVSADGLIKTAVQLDNHYAVIGDDIILKAIVTNATQRIIENGRISFYINGYYVGTDDNLINNTGTVTLHYPGSFYNEHIITGLHNLEARFSGTTQYRSTRAYAYLSVLRTDIIMDISQIPNVIVSGQPFIGDVSFFSADPNNENTPFIPNEQDNNKVSFYIDDQLLGSAEIDVNGQVHFISDNIDLTPGTYTLTVDYHGNGNYVQQHQTKEITIIGGSTNIIVFDSNVKPTYDVDIQAKITDSNNHPVPHGTLTFTINEQEYTTSVKNGFATITYSTEDLREDITQSIEEGNYVIFAHYIDDVENIYQSSEGQGLLVVKKGTAVLGGNKTFYGSQYEPLGFYFNVRDLDTNEPITEGQVTLTVPVLGINVEGTIDDDGGVRILYNPINFSSKDLRELERFNFSVVYDEDPEGSMLTWDQKLQYTREDIADENEALQKLVLMDFYRENDDYNLHFKYLKPEGTIETVDEQDIIIDELPPGFEQVYIDGTNLYARTNLDTLRYYLTGRFDVSITYQAGEAYDSYVQDAVLYLREQTVNIDMLSYDLTYNEQNDALTCYVNEYNLTDDVYRPIDQGSVQFFSDNIKIGQSTIVNGQAILDPSYLKEIEHGTHLLQAIYIPEKGRENTYTYNKLELHRINSNVTASLVTQAKGRKNQLNVTVCIDQEYLMSIEGDIEVYLNDVKIATDYLFGTENVGLLDSSDNSVSHAWVEETGQEMITSNCSHLSFMVDIPEDADINDYTITVKYSGSYHIEPQECTIPIICEKIATTIYASDIKVAKNEKCKLNVEVASTFDDFINEGEIVLKYGQNTIITKSKVKNNKVTLVWDNDQVLETTTYTLYYQGSEHYDDSYKDIQVTSIEPLADIYIKQDIPNDIEFDDTNKEVMTDINEALQCIASGGTIHLVNQVTIQDNIDILKDVNIIGHNNAKIIKDVDDLLSENDSNIKVHNYDEFDQMMYEIVGLSLNHINDKDFCIIDNELYYITAANDFIPIFLLDDGYFYSYQLSPLSAFVQGININIKDAKVNINNVNFMTKDADNINDFIINNRGELSITQCVLNKNVAINNYTNANINNNLVYCDINNYAIIDKNNNWWGSNTIYDNSINNHIIFTLWADEDPLVIGEDIHIHGQLIGANGMEYDLPPVEFYCDAEDGFFSIDNGYTINNVFDTTYFDSTKEDKIYCTIDNETLSLDVLNYDRKTEILLEPFDIPIGYQVNINAKIHSCADYYYDNKIVDNGYVTFYLEDKRIGYAPVESGQAQLSIYLSDFEYMTENDYLIDQGVCKLSATYTPNDYYFASQGEVDVQIINAAHAVYVSPDGNDDNDGTFYKPVKTIEKAITLNKQRIYLKEGIYEDSNINIYQNTSIKKFYGDVIFKEHNDIIFDNESDNNVELMLDGLVFEHNKESIVNNIFKLNIDHCIFQDNETTYLLMIPENDVSVEYDIQIRNSVFVGNNIIINNLSYAPMIDYCWYGWNLNELDDNDIDDVVGLIRPNTYIVMNVDTSKDILYVGSVAKVIASLDKYMYMNDNEHQYHYTDTLPKREAFFCTEIGSIIPTKDDTYKNHATAFLNTMDENKNDNLVITFPDNTNYMYQNTKLQCYVHDIYGKDQNDINVTFEVKDSKNELVYKETVATINGCGTIQTLAMMRGDYTLTCKVDSYYAINYFSVIPAYIQVNECIIEPNDYLYTLTLTLNCTNPLGEKINRQEVDFYIDDVYIDNGIIIDGVLHQVLNYENIQKGNHTLKVTTKGYTSNFEELNYTKEFISQKKDTYIKFTETSLAPNESTDLTFYVYDNNNKPVTTGYIAINFDEAFVANIELQNGIGVLYDFVCTEIKQHYITVQYSGDNFYYHTSLIHQPINVGVEEVIIQPKVTPIVANIGSPLRFDLTITDQSYRSIPRGKVAVYLNDILVNDIIDGNIEYVDVTNGTVRFEHSLPINIKSQTYRLNIAYHDELEKYADTIASFVVNVGSIPTQILIDTIHSYPNTDTTVEYNIQSSIGAVNSGSLIAYYNNEEIGRSMVSDNISQITLHIPKISAEKTYDLQFEYIGSNNFNNASVAVPLVLDKDIVDISTSAANYYPQQSFNLYAYCKDCNEQDLLSGELTLYIDNVKHSTREIVNGIATFILKFNTIKDYQLMFVYEEDEYYQRSIYEEIFAVSNIPITNIEIIADNDLISYPNALDEIELIFATQNNLQVNDGYVDIEFDGKNINTYPIVQGRKFVKINIPNADTGMHDLTVKYYGSSIFKDYEQTYQYTLGFIPFEINVSPVYATIDDTIHIDATFTNNVVLNGILEYYLEDNDGNRRLVDAVSIHDAKEYSHAYVLPNDIGGNERYIIVKYTGDAQHDITEGKGNLIISKQDIALSNIVVDEDIAYQGSFALSFDSNIDIEHNFYVSIDDVPIGIVKSNNGHVTVENLSLTSDLFVGSHMLYIVSPQSAIFNEYESEPIPIQIIQNVPTLVVDDQYDCYVGGEMTLPYIVKDNYGVNLNGSFTYSIDNNVLTVTNNKTILSNTEDVNITIAWVSDDDNFANITDSINVHMLTNNVTVQINEIDTIYRGEEIQLDLEFDSNTIQYAEYRQRLIQNIIGYQFYLTYADCDTDILVSHDINNRIIIPLTLPDRPQYVLHIRSEYGNVDQKIFSNFDKEIILKNNNVDVVTVNDENTYNTTDTLSKAFDLVSDSGTIIINKDLSDEIAYNDKKVVVNGNNHTMSRCAIHNDGQLTVQYLMMVNSNDSAIVNNGELYVHTCMFTNNNAQYGAAIYIDSKNNNTEIIDCVFTNNNASLYGGAIFSNKGNDVKIQSCTFGESNCANSHGSSISINGNMYIKDNIFYGNDGNDEIFVMNGTLEAEDNYFEGNIKTINNLNGKVSANLNYWGYNDIENIEQTWNGIVMIDNWLISDYDVYYTEPRQTWIYNHVTGHINKYQSRTTPEITMYKDIAGKMKIDNIYYNLNSEPQETIIGTIYIGQEEFDITPEAQEDDEAEP